MSEAGSSPLQDLTVLDVSRMLPGAVLARTLLDLGARLIKIEAPGTGDPLRTIPPLVGGVGAGFCAFFRGAESVCIDLGEKSGARRLRRLVAHADVLIESFRPGRLAKWGLGPERLLADRPSLIVCSLPSYENHGGAPDRVGHDINFVAESGLLTRLSERAIPRVQVADIVAGLLAVSALLAALVERGRSGRGAHVVQPLVSGPLPLLTWAFAEMSAGETDSASERLLSGGCPAYHLYRCGDGRALALGAIEPKFWASFVELLGLPQLEGAGLDTGAAGAAAAGSVEERLATAPRDHWLALAAGRGLPLTPVNDLEEAAAHLGPLMERTPAPDGTWLTTPGPYIPSAGRTPASAAPRLDQHRAAIFEEFGVE